MSGLFIVSLFLTPYACLTCICSLQRVLFCIYEWLRKLGMRKEWRIHFTKLINKVSQGNKLLHWPQLTQNSTQNHKCVINLYPHVASKIDYRYLLYLRLFKPALGGGSANEYCYIHTYTLFFVILCQGHSRACSFLLHASLDCKFRLHRKIQGK